MIWQDPMVYLNMEPDIPIMMQNSIFMENNVWQKEEDGLYGYYNTANSLLLKPFAERYQAVELAKRRLLFFINFNGIYVLDTATNKLVTTAKYVNVHRAFIVQYTIEKEGNVVYLAMQWLENSMNHSLVWAFYDAQKTSETIYNRCFFYECGERLYHNPKRCRVYQLDEDVIVLGQNLRNCRKLKKFSVLQVEEHANTLVLFGKDQTHGNAIYFVPLLDSVSQRKPIFAPIKEDIEWKGVEKDSYLLYQEAENVWRVFDCATFTLYDNSFEEVYTTLK